MRKHPFVSKAGMILPLLILCACAVGFLFAPNDPELVDLTKKFLAPCPELPLGADNLGRCVLSRLLYGGRTTLGIVLVGSLTVSVFGTLIGLLMGGGKNGKNLILEGVLNAVTAIPPIAYLIIFIAAWGNSVFTMVVAVSASLLLRVIKLVQTRTRIEQGKAYVTLYISAVQVVKLVPYLAGDGEFSGFSDEEGGYVNTAATDGNEEAELMRLEESTIRYHFQLPYVCTLDTGDLMQEGIAVDALQGASLTLSFSATADLEEALHHLSETLQERRA